MSLGCAAQMTRRRRWAPGLGLRLLLAQALVLVAGAATTWIIAAVVGPPLFREHLHQAGVAADSMEEVHAEQAYTFATMYAVGGALAVSALTALVVSWYVSRRLQRSVTEVARAATTVADGRYDIRVSQPNLGVDFEMLATAFNQMAARLDHVEATRVRLFGDLAHEIRTPVAVLDAYVEAILDGVRPLTPQTAATLRDQTRRLVRFADDAAALARAEDSSVSLTWTTVDVGALLDTAASSAAGGYRAKQVLLAVNAATDLPLLRADPDRLFQVLGNLLDNALRHTPSGGRVELSAASVEGGALLSVGDTGEGIAAEHLPHVFERFYRADPARDRAAGGAGIGLAIVKALVESHNGRIAVSSDGPGHGCSFAVFLPVTDPAPTHSYGFDRPIAAAATQ